MLLSVCSWARALEDEAPPLLRRRARQLIKISDIEEEEHHENTRDKTFIEEVLEESGFWSRELASSLSMEGIQRQLAMNSMSMMNVRQLASDVVVDTPTVLNDAEAKNPDNLEQPLLEAALEDTHYWNRELGAFGSMSMLRALGAFGSMSMNDDRRLVHDDQAAITGTKITDEEHVQVEKDKRISLERALDQEGVWTRDLEMVSMSVPPAM